MTAEFNQDIRAAVSVLRKGGVILYPTDTVWGLGCDATNPEAVRKVFAIKRRSDAKALITLVGSLAQLERTVDCIPEVAYQLIEYADRPTTIIYDHPSAAARIAPELVAEDGTTGSIPADIRRDRRRGGLCVPVAARGGAERCPAVVDNPTDRRRPFQNHPLIRRPVISVRCSGLAAEASLPACRRQEIKHQRQNQIINRPTPGCAIVSSISSCGANVI